MKKLKLWVGIFIFCIIVCTPLLQMHIASDTYNLMDVGYLEYAKVFLRSARIMSAAALSLAGVLNLSYEVFIVGMEILATIITSFSIYLLYKTIIEKVSEKSEEMYHINLKNMLFLMGSVLVIFNCMALEYLLYAESPVMCLSLFLCILAARIFTMDTKHKYIKALSILMLSTFCYQGCISIFITLVFLLLIIDKNKLKAREIIKQFIIAGILTGISCVINTVAIYILNAILGTQQVRIAEKNSLLMNPPIWIPFIMRILEIALVNNFGLWPTGINIVFIIASILVISYAENNVFRIMKYMCLIGIAIVATILPVFFMQSPSIEARTAMSIGSIIGISLIYLNTLNVKNSKILGTIIAIMTIGFFIFNTMNTIQIFSAHIATNKIDANMGMSIKYKIEEYEERTGNTITKVAYHRDDMHRDFPYGYDKKLFSFTQRAFDNYFCIVEALNYYCNRKFETVSMNQEIYEENFKGKNWDAYADEQIVFENDTMYLCTY